LRQRAARHYRAAMTSYRVGLIGWGTVGGGVLELLQRDRTLLAERCGLDIRIDRIVTRDPSRARRQSADGAQVSDDIASIVDDPGIEAVLHLVGGVDAAKDLALACLRAGKHVITANKALLAEHWDELVREASAHQASIAFEAAVAGGIPVIAALRDGLVGNRIQSIHAILNGTCNYILTRMEEDGLPYEDALALAKELGYAESDPAFDVSGIDSAHKLAILARIAFNAPISFDSVSIEGIEAIPATDIASAGQMNCRIKLMAVASLRQAGLELRVAPTLVPLDYPLAAVRENYNAVRIEADAAGPTLLLGQGAGAHPTASAMLADLVDVATGRYQETMRRFRFFEGATPVRILPEAEELTASYARFTVRDEPGVLALLATTLSKHGVSVLSVHQSEPADEDRAVIEITTYPCRGGEFLQAIRELDATQITLAPTVILRRMTY